eukprot:363842-Chlamydomonas_euryale.AAC.9
MPQAGLGGAQRGSKRGSATCPTFCDGLTACAASTPGLPLLGRRRPAQAPPLPASGCGAAAAQPPRPGRCSRSPPPRRRCRRRPEVAAPGRSRPAAAAESPPPNATATPSGTFSLHGTARGSFALSQFAPTCLRYTHHYPTRQRLPTHKRQVRLALPFPQHIKIRQRQREAQGPPLSHSRLMRRAMPRVAANCIPLPSPSPSWETRGGISAGPQAQPPQPHQSTAGRGLSVPRHQLPSVSAAAFRDQSRRDTAAVSVATPMPRSVADSSA